MTDIIIIASTFGIALFYAMIRLWMWFQYKAWIQPQNKVIEDAIKHLFAAELAFRRIGVSATAAASAIGRFNTAIRKGMDNRPTKHRR